MPSTSICFFEDKAALRFRPLILTRPLDDLRIGVYTIRKKWLHDTGASGYMRKIRPELKKLFPNESEPGGSVIWINSRVMPDPVLVHQISTLEPGHCITTTNELLAARTDQPTTERWLETGPEIKNFRTEQPAGPPRLLRELWDLLEYNHSEIALDIDRTSEKTGIETDVSAGIHVQGKHAVYAGKNVTLEPGATFITNEGPIYIGPDAVVMAGSIIRGPAAVCRGAVVRMGAKVYENTTIGPVCKVGGEINNVIFHSYTNKAHDGYAGNSIFGQWCNLGADTNTSNLKNNYQTVQFVDWSTRKVYDTGELFLGTVMSDHCKTGINSMLTTGTNCGVCCNLFSHGFPPKFIPSFSWVNSSNTEIFQFDKAVETMERTMRRRSVEISAEYIEMMRHLFENRM